MKKFFGALAVSAVLTGSAYANPFNDVDRDHWAYDAVNKVASSGIMRGYRDGVFKGKETVTRYEMALIISRLIDKLQGGNVSADVRRTMDRLGEEFMDELDLIGARLTALENAFHEHVTEYNKGGMGGDSNGFKFSGDTRIRWQNRSEDMATAAAGAAATKDDQSRYQMRTYVGIEKSVDRADLYLELEHAKTFGQRAGGLGTTGVAAGDLDLHQAWANVQVTDNSALKIGRMEIDLGDGSIISSYDYLQAAQSYDGWIFHGDTDNFDYKVWSLELDNTGNGAVVAGAAALAADTELHGIDLDFDDVFDGALHTFYYHFNGVGNVVGSTLDVYGFDWTRSYDEWDVYVQYAAQGGDNGVAGAGNVDNDGDMWNLRAMYELDEDDTIGLEYTVYSGDDVPTAAGAVNNSFEGWVNVAGDNHSRLGYADVIGMGNVEDITFHWHHDVNERNKFGLAYHMFNLENDRTAAVLAGGGLPGAWTGVAGPAAASGVNGVAGAIAAGNNNAFNDDLGDELDLWWNHKLSDDINISLGYAMFSAGDYFTAFKAAGAAANYAPDVNYAWITTNIKF